MTEFLVCTEIDSCSGQSGSGAWVLREGSHYVAATLSGYGGVCHPANRLTRITGVRYDWMQTAFGECTCTSGGCCDGCSFLGAGEVCRPDAGVQYRCEPGGCGARAQRRTAERLCTGGSAACDGDTVWGPWEDVAACGEDQLCETDSTSQARCSSCPHGCSGGRCCACSSGPCCDGCDFRPASSVCDESAAVEHGCRSGECGADAVKRVKRRMCGGAAAACGGEETWGAWEVIEDCRESQLCRTDGATWARCQSCLAGCRDGLCIDEDFVVEGGCACGVVGAP